MTAISARLYMFVYIYIYPSRPGMQLTDSRGQSTTTTTGLPWPVASPDSRLKD